VPWAERAARCSGPALPDEGRDQHPVLRDAPDEATPRLGRLVPRGRVLAGRAGRVLQLRRRYRDRLEVGPLPRADPLASCHVGPPLAGPRTPGAGPGGGAGLPPAEDRQARLPAEATRRG